jgi:hypothetical protein
MVDFKEVELTDRQRARETLSYSDYRGCEYTFGNNFLWQCVFYTKIACYKDFYLIKSGGGGYFFPAGKGDFREAVEVLRADAAKDNSPLRFVTMNRESKNWLMKNYPGEFEFTTDRSFYDYIYNFADLSELKGKKYHSKRNFINRFRMNKWCYEPITPQNVCECICMNERWLKECETAGSTIRDDSSLIRENCVVNAGLEHFFDLGFTGGLLRANGEVVAFTFGEPVNRDTFVVHAEKAFARITGAYPAINNEFVNHACSGFAYINREEDMGLENLRKAKLSYHPAFLEEKFKAVSRA